MMSDPVTGLTIPASSRVDGGIGTHGGTGTQCTDYDYDFVAAKMSEHLDRFLTGDLRVNREACGGGLGGKDMIARMCCSIEWVNNGAIDVFNVDSVSYKPEIAGRPTLVFRKDGETVREVHLEEVRELEVEVIGA